ncbi:MAG TPA: hypothetical protein VHV10_04390 [Ktedonobacteraceae bacterium]|nr:hypothetical protein [Ktedonobacteraceae bacterium]
MRGIGLEVSIVKVVKVVNGMINLFRIVAWKHYHYHKESPWDANCAGIMLADFTSQQ